jgi:hypothetical protein
MADVRKIPSPPSRRNLPAVIPPPDDVDTPASWLQRLAASAHTMATELHGKALNVLRDPDLTGSGQRKAIAREAARTINRLQGRIAEEVRRLAGERKTLTATVGAKVAGDRISEARQAEWRQVLRSMSREERIATLRAAASGEMAAGEEVIATLLGASSPLLCGFPVGDPAIDLLLDEHRQRHAATELTQIAELDASQALAEQALGWLDEYAVELLEGDTSLLRDAQATDKGHRPLSDLTSAEKSQRIADAYDAGVTGPDALFRPADGEAQAGSAGSPLSDADIAKFAALPLSRKAKLAELHGSDLQAAIRGAKEG